MEQPVKIQQRWSPRVPIEIGVALYTTSPPILAQTRDLSLGGMFLHSPAPLLLNTVIVLGFGFSEGEERVYYRLPATVVRVCDDGVGLMFNRFEVDTVNSLRRLLYGRQAEAVPVAPIPLARSRALPLAVFPLD